LVGSFFSNFFFENCEARHNAAQKRTVIAKNLRNSEAREIAAEN
jgi:hypothetical protein